MTFGIILLESLISSAGIVDISKPAYAQNVKTRADPKLPMPNGQNSEKFVIDVAVFEATYNKPATAKKISGARA
jgi:hypothetical protein